MLQKNFLKPFFITDFFKHIVSVQVTNKKNKEKEKRYYEQNYFNGTFNP